MYKGVNEININKIKGIKVGNAQDLKAGTGCTVVICDNGATPGVDVRGGSPGTRETDLIDPQNFVDKIHGVVLSGGSAFGLDASSGVMKYLEERNIGFDVNVTKVPIVSSAILFDLNVGDSSIRPDFKMGYEACKNAEKNECLSGNIGAGTGASVGKLFGIERAMKGGLGCYAVEVGKLQVGAIVAVNCLGNILDPETGEQLAGLLDKDKKNIISTEEQMLLSFDKEQNLFLSNTTIGVVITNGKFTKAQANKIASMAHDGYGRTMRPAHSMFDGDTIFALATGEVEAEINVVGFLSAKVMEKAIIKAIKEADFAYGLKSYKDIKNNFNF